MEMSSRSVPSAPSDRSSVTLDDFRNRLVAAGFDETSATVESNGTIAAGELGGAADELDEAAVPDDLPRLISAERSELALKQELGRGGMGHVMSAEQLPLEREVAVKCVVGASPNRHEVAVELIREARVTGALEHPNIVPVHALGTNDRGDVLLVMKRIDGTSWAEQLRARPNVAHDLERHLQILMQVCMTVAFAHSRGVIHRDLKPENVMVGAFGEIYVLDWGLAMAIRDDAPPAARRARGRGRIAGTPQYMAPEMTEPDAPLDERTDVYLLGATLHAIVCERGPHTGATVMEMLFQAHLSSPPVFGDEVPLELAAICARALARDPAERFASAEALRVAIDGFLRHSHARGLCEQAERHLEALRALVSTRSRDDVAANRAFSAARFGFEAAARAWQDSVEAQEGLAAALETMARFEIERRHPDAAAVLVGELRHPSPELVRSLDLLRVELAREADRKARNEQVAQDVDLRPAQRRRSVAIGTIGVGWMAVGIANGVMLRADLRTPSHGEMIAVHALVALAILVAMPWLVPKDASRAGRSLIETGVVAFTGCALIWTGIWYLEAPLAAGLAGAQVLAAAAAWAVLSFFDRRVLWFPVLGFAVAPAMLALERYAFDLNGVTIGCGLCVLAWKWRK
jgi:eukaryotic-like serine/threonine-protein kinase